MIRLMKTGRVRYLLPIRYKQMCIDENWAGITVEYGAGITDAIGVGIDTIITDDICTTT